GCCAFSLAPVSAAKPGAIYPANGPCASRPMPRASDGQVARVRTRASPRRAPGGGPRKRAARLRSGNRDGCGAGAGDVRGPLDNGSILNRPAVDVKEKGNGEVGPFF